MSQILFVGCGGFLGSVARYLLGTMIGRSIVNDIPYPTIIINLLGSFIIGMSLSLLDSRTHPTFFYFLIPGFLGGFTTYSAFSAEAVSLFQKQLFTPALAYIFLTLIGGLGFCALGMFASKVFIKS